VVAMSPRPGRIARIVDVALSRPRTVDMEFCPQFKSYSDQIRAVIFHGEGGGSR
jgi:NitT/TauT family transport system ATP-binding protein